MANSLISHHGVVTRPTKEQVRRWMDERQRSSQPPPSLTEIRRQLGWELVHPAARMAR